MKMLRKLLIPTLTLTSIHIYAQNCSAPTAMHSIGGNNITAYVQNSGTSFQNTTTAGFLIDDNGTQKSTIFASGLWMGAYDDGGNLRLAAARYSG